MSKLSQLPSVIDLQREINRLFEPMGWLGRFEGSPLLSSADWAPAIDIKDEPDHYLIHVDVPGVDPNQIEITFENGILTIKGQRETHSEEKDETYIRIERSQGSFFRSFNLPESVDSDRITAKSKNGVLDVIVPKTKKPYAKKIAVQSH